MALEPSIIWEACIWGVLSNCIYRRLGIYPFYIILTEVLYTVCTYQRRLKVDVILYMMKSTAN